MANPLINSGDAVLVVYSRTLAKEISVIGHNFSFVQVKYPSVYKW